MKVSPRVCRECGSPSRGNPCWYAIKFPRWSASGGDPPCFDQFYADRGELRAKRQRDCWIAFFICAALLVGGAFFLDWLSR